MSRSIDEQIVSMKLDNSQFQKGVQTTLDTLSRLKDMLTFKGAGKGLNDINVAGQGVKLDHIAASVDTIKGKFQTMSIAGIAALGAIATKALNWGQQMAANMFEPLQQGFAEYELKMGSIQTILANTERHGTSLETVNAELDELNKYADKTIYNFAAMTKNASLFTNAGIKIEDATSMIKGFSNSAAASGTSAEGAAGAAYQLSQAMSSGMVRLMDWRSLTNVGMGGKNMQDGIINVASAMGTFNDETTTATAAGKDFNGSLEKQWLTADVMSNYLRIMAGDMDRAAMAALGLSDTQIDTLEQQAKTAEEAATKVRTFTQLMGTLAEANASGWTDTAEIIIGDFTEATDLFTAISDTLGGLIGRGAENRNRILQDWKDLGGRNDIIQGFKNIWDAFASFINPIAKAWASVFGVVAEGAEIFETPISRMSYVLKAVTQAFETFTSKLKMGGIGIALVTGIFTTLFKILKFAGGVIAASFDEVVAVVGGVIKYFFQLGVVIMPLIMAIGNLAEGIGMLIGRFLGLDGVSNVIKTIFDALIKARDNVVGPLADSLAIVVNAFANLAKYGNKELFLSEMKRALDSLDGPLEGIRKNIQNLLGGIERGSKTVSNFAKGFSLPILEKVSFALAAISEAFGILKDKVSGFKIDFDMPKFFSSGGDTKRAATNASNLSKAWSGVVKVFSAIVSAIAPIAEDLVAIITSAVDKIRAYIEDLGFEEAVALVNTGFFIAMYVAIAGFFKKMGGLVNTFTEVLKNFEGLGKTIADTLDTVKGAVKAWQQDVKANIILKIAIAMGVLAASLWVISTIDPEQMARSLVAIGTMFGLMVGTLKIFDTLDFTGTGGMLKAMAGLILLSIAIGILSIAVRNLSGMDWEELAKGLIGVAGLLVALALFTKFAEADSGGIKSGIGLILLAVAINLLVGAVQKFGQMDVDTLKQGLLAVTALLILLAVVSRAAEGGNMIKAAVGILILAASLTAMYFIIKLFAAMDVETLGIGLIKMAAALTLVAFAMQAMPKDMLVNAAALVIVAGALWMLSGVIAVMGLMGWEQIAKGLTTLGGALIIIAVAMRVMSTTLAGAAALIIVAGALYLLVPLLVALGSLPWEVVLLGLGALAGIFVILGLAGLVLAPVVPVITALAIAIGLLGLAMMLAGAGIFLFTAGFALLIGAITAAVALGVAAFTSFLNLIPLFMQQIALGLIAFAKVISDAGPVLVNAMATVLLAILEAIRRVAPSFYFTMEVLIMGMVMTVMRLIPRLAQAGLRLIQRLLEIIRDNIDPIIDTAADIIEKFIRGLERNTPRLVDAGVDLIVEFIESLAASLTENEDRLNAAGKDLAGSIVGGMASGIWGGIKSVTDAARGVAESALSAAKRWLGISSPSKEFFKVGRWSSEGQALGMEKYGHVVAEAATSVGMDTINAMKKTIANMPDFSKLPVDVQPRITPVLDLSDVAKGVKELDPMLAGHSMSVDTSYAGAVVAERAYARSLEARDERDAGFYQNTKEVTFTQNLNSPKPLPRAEIYRNTKNAISILKGVLDD